MITSQIPQYIFTGVVTGSFFALVATSMQVIYGSSRVLNFAQGEFVVGGMFAMWLLRSSWGLNPWLALLIVLGVGFVGGAIFYLIVVRPLDGRQSLQIVLATLAGGIVLRSVYAIVFGSQVKVVQPFIKAKPFHLWSVVLNPQDLFMIGGALLSLGLLFLMFNRTWIGLAMRSTAENREGAEVSGVDPRLISLLAFGISGTISAFAGALISPNLGVRFDFGLQFVLTAFVAATLGGLSSTIGSAVGGFVLGLSFALIAAAVGSEYQSLWLLVLIVPLLYFRPHGVAGKLVRE